MSQQKTIQLVQRPVNDELTELTPEQIERLGELALLGR